jgi:hypothetical protein
MKCHFPSQNDIAHSCFCPVYMAIKEPYHDVVITLWHSLATIMCRCLSSSGRARTMKHLHVKNDDAAILHSSLLPGRGNILGFGSFHHLFHIRLLQLQYSLPRQRLCSLVMPSWDTTKAYSAKSLIALADISPVGGDYSQDRPTLQIIRLKQERVWPGLEDSGSLL